jgi:hypothetical protein
LQNAPVIRRGIFISIHYCKLFPGITIYLKDEVRFLKEQVEGNNFYIFKDSISLKTRNAGHTQAFKKPNTPIQKLVACTMK